MGKMKFTLNLMLLILFFGANVSRAQYTDANWSMPFDDHEYPITANIHSSPHYLMFYGGIYCDYTSHTEFYGGYSVILDSSSIKRDNLEIPDFSSWIAEYRYSILDSCLKYNSKLYNYGKIEMLYENGKEVIPYIKRIVTVGEWKYNTNTRRNVLRPTNIVLEELLLPDSVYPKTDFTYGTGVATYVYTSDMMSMYLKYPFYSIHYEIWVDEEIGGNEPGPENGNVYLNHAITIDAADGIITNPLSGMVTYTRAKKDFIFDVTCEPGKELEVTTDHQLWSANKGSIIITPVEAGKWSVKLLSISSHLNITVGYKADSESDITGIIAPFGDKVWASGGTLFVKTANAGKLSIYSATGQLCKTTSVNGNYSATMPKGLYIVRLNGKAYKVIL